MLYENLSQREAGDVTLDVTLPEGASLVSSSSDGESLAPGSASGADLGYALPPLAAGVSGEIALALKLPAILAPASTVSLVARIAGRAPDPDGGNNYAEQGDRLALDLSDLPPRGVGEIVVEVALDAGVALQQPLACTVGIAAAGGEFDVANNRAEDVQHVQTEGPDVWVELASQGDDALGGTHTYEVRYGNRGTEPAGDVAVSLAIPSILQGASFSRAPASYADGVLRPDVLHPLDAPLASEGGIAVLHGNLAPGGAVAKQSAVAPAMRQHTGPARVFECEEEVRDSLMSRRVVPGDVLVIRNEGPRGGPGMRELSIPAAMLVGMGLGESVAMVTDGRYSGATRGPVSGMSAPRPTWAGPSPPCATATWWRSTYRTAG